MNVRITGLSQINANVRQLQRQVKKAQTKAIRRGLNAGAKVLEKAIQPHVPVLRSSTNFRQKGTVKKNVRHRTKVARDGNSGYTIIKIMRPKGQRMAHIGENTRDKRDPFYWWMVNYGTKKMSGRHFMEKGANAGKSQALKVAAETAVAELKEAIKTT